MAQPPFLLQIADRDGVVVRTRAGGKHETDLIDILVTSIVARGVGFPRTEHQVKQAIRAGILDAITSLKVQNPFDVV